MLGMHIHHLLWSVVEVPVVLLLVLGTVEEGSLLEFSLNSEVVLHEIGVLISFLLYEFLRVM